MRIETSAQIDEGVNTTETGLATHSLTGHEPRDVNSASSSLSTLSTPITSEELARQIKTATDLLTKQLQQLCCLMKVLRQVPPKRNKETPGLIQVSSRVYSSRCDNYFQWAVGIFFQSYVVFQYLIYIRFICFFVNIFCIIYPSLTVLTVWYLIFLDVRLCARALHVLIPPLSGLLVSVSICWYFFALIPLFRVPFELAGCVNVSAFAVDVSLVLCFTSTSGCYFNVRVISIVNFSGNF